MEEEDKLTQNLKPSEIPEENLENNINTEENIISNPSPFPSTTPISANDSEIKVAPVVQDSPNNKSGPDTNSIWFDLSIISWFLFLCTGLTLYKQSSNFLSSIFSQYLNYVPIGSNISLVVGFISAISTIGFIVYFKNTALKKNQNMINSFLNDMSKFHCVSFFLVSLLFTAINEPTVKASYIFGIILSLLAYGSLIFVYLKTEFNGEWYEVIATKKGVFSSLIAFTLYTLCVSITHAGESASFAKGCGIAFSFLIGLLNIGFGFYFKDLVVLIVNLLIYFEMAKCYFYTYNIDGEKINKGADGGIDILMIIASIGAIFYLLFKQRDSIYK